MTRPSRTTDPARPSFPAVALTGSRARLDAPTPLAVRWGAVPEGMRGAWFVVSADGHAGGEGEAERQRRPFLNGDGFVARLSFGPGGVMALRRPVETPCFVADEAAAASGDPDYVFQGFGITRTSPRLGQRNFANTALQAVRFPGQRTRLLATYDAGRPSEIDPTDLSFVRPIGRRPEWQGGIGRDLPFPFFTSTAHPAWDAEEGALYLVDCGRPLRDFAAGVALLMRRPRAGAPTDAVAAGEDEEEAALKALGLLEPPTPEEVAEAERVADALFGGLVDEEAAGVERLAAWVDEEERRVVAELEARALADVSWGQLLRFAVAFVKGTAARVRTKIARVAKRLFTGAPTTPVAPGPKAPFLRLLRWRGQGGARMLEAFELVDDEGPIHIRASCHQVLATRRFVVVLDTTFKFESDIAMPMVEDGGARGDEMARRIRARMSRPQPACTRGWLVPKDALRREGEVLARRFELDAEVVHLVADYEDEGGVVLHAVDNRLTDPAEFLLRGDRLAMGAGPVPEGVLSMMPCGLERNALRTFRVRAPDLSAGADGCAVELMGEVDDMPDRPGEAPRLWTIGLGASAELFGPRPLPARTTRSFWYTQGLEPAMVSELVADLYREHPRRETPWSEVEALARRGVAPVLARVRHEVSAGADGFLLEEVFELPPGLAACSVHVVPRREAGRPWGSREEARAGWVVCAVFGTPAPGWQAPAWGEGVGPREVWVFDSERLGEGPVLRLDAGPLGWPYTLHASWIDEADLPTSPVPASERFGFGEDEYAHATDAAARRFLAAAFAAHMGADVHDRRARSGPLDPGGADR